MHTDFGVGQRDWTGFAGSAYYYVEDGYARQTYFDRWGLEPLLGVLSEFDRCRMILARKGGNVLDLRGFAAVINKAFTVYGPQGSAKATLVNPGDIKSALLDAGQYDVHLEVRRTHYGMPMYYLARTQHDYWGQYGLVIEDLYLSEDYPIDDPRFVKLMRSGQGKYFLRLAHLREAAAAMAGLETRDDVDNLLYTVGRCALEGAWHTDQRFAFMVANAFDLPEFRSALELTYLCLNADLSKLRAHSNGHMPTFFTSVYPNEGIVRLMAMLPGMTGKAISALSQAALESYVAITALFNQFLKTEVTWGAIEKAPMPLWKLLLANAKRLDTVARLLRRAPALHQARREFIAGAEGCIQEILAAGE